MHCFLKELNYFIYINYTLQKCDLTTEETTPKKCKSKTIIKSGCPLTSKLYTYEKFLFIRGLYFSVICRGRFNQILYAIPTRPITSA